MKKLIINADDFGFNREITDGIVNCHKAGTVTSTTMMVNMPAADYAASRIPEFPGMSVGIHLNMTLGRPLLKPSSVPSLVNEQGFFCHHKEMFSRAFKFKLNPREIEKELSAQIEKFLSYGVKPTHCDSHHHIADCPQVFAIKIKVLRKFGICRIRTQRGWYHRDKQQKGLRLWLGCIKVNLRKSPNRIYYEFQHFYSRLNGFIQPDERYGLAKVVSAKPLEYTLDGFKAFVVNCPHGVVEHVVHPGLPSSDPMDRPEYILHRKQEYDLLTDPQCLSMIKSSGIELINFTQF